ncbi:MAG: hypothetical protein PWQ10_662 [Patescibacteria group bacterium]|nr:hypothetical protein [Patescibacteria group bacterium]
MNEKPKYNPNQWIHYKYGNSGQGVSRIRSIAFLKNKGWMYKVENPMSPETTMLISEKDIIGKAESA